MLYAAEYVLPGQPDKLCDAIADALVEEAACREKRALCGIEVAVHRRTLERVPGTSAGWRGELPRSLRRPVDRHRVRDRFARHELSSTGALARFTVGTAAGGTANRTAGPSARTGRKARAAFRCRLKRARRVYIFPAAGRGWGRDRLESGGLYVRRRRTGALPRGDART